MTRYSLFVLKVPFNVNQPTRLANYYILTILMWSTELQSTLALWCTSSLSRQIMRGPIS